MSTSYGSGVSANNYWMDDISNRYWINGSYDITSGSVVPEGHVSDISSFMKKLDAIIQYGLAPSENIDQVSKAKKELHDRIVGDVKSLYESMEKKRCKGRISGKFYSDLDEDDYKLVKSINVLIEHYNKKSPKNIDLRGNF